MVTEHSKGEVRHSPAFIITATQPTNLGTGTRIALNYKGIPYTTEWIEYPDIENKLKSIGGKPTSKKKDGSDHYTLPAIHDSKTGKVVTDSKDIIVYLEETYPDTPSLFPPGKNAAIELQTSVFDDAFDPLYPLTLQASNAILNPVSEAYFRRTREASFGKKIEEFAPPGPARDEIWSKFKANLQKLSSAYDANGPNSLFFIDNTFTYSDVVVAAYLLWVKLILGADNAEWKEFASWYGGRWGKFLDATTKWQAFN